MVQLIAQFRDADGNDTGPQVYLPSDTTPQQLQGLINDLLENEETEGYLFRVGDSEISSTVESAAKEFLPEGDLTEQVLPITFLPQAPFKVRPVCRCSNSMQGHQEAVLAVRFSPCGRHLVTGSGDTTVRVWDLNTFTPKQTLKGHKNWVLCVEWSPNSRYFATGDMVGALRVWDAETMQCVYSVPKAHAKYITSMSWEPLHRNKDCTRLATAGKDGVLRVWNVVRHVKEYASTCHSMSITSVRWGGEGLIYTASQDRTIKVHADKDGKLVRSLEGHGHWVNTLAVNTDHVLRTGAFDYTGAIPASPEEAQAKALERYNAVKGAKPEVLVSGSDDFTCFIWHPSKDKKPVSRLTGHQQPINLVSFSPDGNYIASASFDKSLKIWNGSSGKFIATFRGHVSAVYQVCWSSDSRLIVSGSKDSTMKVWNVATKRLENDLPGHADEVYSVDWSPDGSYVGSGSKDRLVKIWRS
mmetsp:Transcript_14587/g.57276  ORF Transcript_14587/g.57276 Transcript_14587/m.57276 type:complete len:470 (+) Transcript_14587:15-1424(+)